MNPDLAILTAQYGREFHARSAAARRAASTGGRGSARHALGTLRNRRERSRAAGSGRRA
jgi:hypothetical protein